MKKFISFLFFIVLSVVIFQSCSNNDDDNPTINLSNEISIDGTIYTMDGTAVVQSYGVNNDGSFDRDIEIFSNNLFVEFDLNTSSDTEIPDGIYPYSNTRQVFTFYNVEIELRENNTTTIYNIKQGTVTVTNNGNSTTIECNLVTQDGLPVIGKWSGIIQ